MRSKELLRSNYYQAAFEEHSGVEPSRQDLKNVRN